MSLGVAIKGAEGVVLAADCRVTVGVGMPGGPIPGFFVNYDNATKILTFSKPHRFVGVVTYGLGLIGQRTVHSYLPELELALPKERATVLEYAKAVSGFFLDRWNELGQPPVPKGAPGITFLIGGYDEGEAYGRVYLCEIPEAPEPTPRNEGKDDFGMTWGGQIEVVSRLVHGFDPALPDALAKELGLQPPAVEAFLAKIRPHFAIRIPYNLLPLQDCVDLATFLIRTTITAQRLSATVRGVGGPIEVAIITRTGGLHFLQQKTLRAEAGSVASVGGQA
jgi:hypothetical protein